MVENIFIISRDKHMITLVKGVLNEKGDHVEVAHNFQGVTESLKRKQFRLIIIDCALKCDADYFVFIKFVQEFNMVPFLLLSSANDPRCLDNIKYAAPDGFLLFPFNDIQLQICIAVIQAKFDKAQKNRAELEVYGDMPLAIKKTLTYIDFNIFRKIEVTDLADITQWEKNYFIKLFLKYVGVTPYQYILVKKVEKAKLLIIETDYPINQISYELGFKSYTNFVSAFKKITDSCPSHYKRFNSRNVKLDSNHIFYD